MIVPRLEWLLPEPFPEPPSFAGFGRPVGLHFLERHVFRSDVLIQIGDPIEPGPLFELYKKVTEKKRSWPEQRRIFENEVLPAWRHRRVADLSRRDIRMLVEDRKSVV